MIDFQRQVTSILLGNISLFRAIVLHSRDTSKGCPYEPDDDNEEKAPDGIAKVLDRETE